MWCGSYRLQLPSLTMKQTNVNKKKKKNKQTKQTQEHKIWKIETLLKKKKNSKTS